MLPFSIDPRLLSGLAPILLASVEVSAQPAGADRFVNPPGLSPPTGYTHVVVAPDDQTVYVAGQVAYDSGGRIAGAGDFRTQVERSKYLHPTQLPASTLVQVAGLVRPELLIEIEAVAVLPRPRRP